LLHLLTTFRDASGYPMRTHLLRRMPENLSARTAVVPHRQEASLSSSVFPVQHRSPKVSIRIRSRLRNWFDFRNVTELFENSVNIDLFLLIVINFKYLFLFGLSAERFPSISSYPCRNVLFVCPYPQHICRQVRSFTYILLTKDRLCGLVVRVLGYRAGGPGSIPGTTRKKSSGSGTGYT
jgi:hypothetical protein